MPMRAVQKMFEDQENYAAKRSAQLDTIYREEVDRIYNEKLLSSNSRNGNGMINPIIHVSSQPSQNCNFNITLNDDQFREFMMMVKDTLLLLS